jgi:hypothetical protein
MKINGVFFRAILSFRQRRNHTRNATTIEPLNCRKHENEKLLILSVMKECKTLQLGKTTLKNGFYWLNELAEILNPYLVFSVEEFLIYENDVF